MPKQEGDTKAKKLERIRKVQSLIMDGYGRSEILKYSEENGWDQCRSTIDNYIKEATDGFNEKLYEDFDEERAGVAARLNNLYRVCLKKDKYKEALATQQELNKLLGLYNTDGSATGDATFTGIEVNFVGPDDDDA